MGLLVTLLVLAHEFDNPLGNYHGLAQDLPVRATLKSPISEPKDYR